MGRKSRKKKKHREEADRAKAEQAALDEQKHGCRWGRVATIGWMIVIMAVVLYFWDRGQVSEKPQSGEVVPADTMVSTHPVSAPLNEDQRFIDEVLEPTLLRAAESYPIESIRLRFAEVNNKFLSQEYMFVINSKPQPAIAMAHYEDGKVGVAYVLSSMRDLHSKVGPELFMDYLVEVTLHEDFHIQHHPPNDGSLDDRVKEEDEAWQHMCEHVLLPMQEHGRLLGLPMDDSVRYAIHCYHLSSGERQHKAWQAFVLFACNEISERDLQKVLVHYKD